MFQKDDFEVFNEPTLAGRMKLIKTQIDPSFTALAPAVISEMERIQQQDLYAHIAKHLRRTKNPPVDTWVAFSYSKRGYKGQPHLEIGYWPDYLFVYWDLLAEAKAKYSSLIDARLGSELKLLPANFVIGNDHTDPSMQPLNNLTVEAAIQQAQQNKKAELVVGRNFAPTDPLFSQPLRINETILTIVQQLAKLPFEL